jgi:hypothetical protein
MLSPYSALFTEHSRADTLFFKTQRQTQGGWRLGALARCLVTH